MNKSTKKSNKAINSDSLIEQLKSLGSGVGSSIKNDLISDIGSDALSSLFGFPKSGELKPGKPVQLSQKDQPQEPENIENFPFAQKPKRPENFSSQISREIVDKIRETEMQVGRQIEEIRMELRALVATIKNVSREVEIAASSNIIDGGAYHLVFLNRLKTMLKVMRKNLSSSSTWLNVMNSRKKERKYWNQYKKKGTTFGLSNERSVSTQVG